MSTDYDKIREENIEEYGKGTRHLSFLSTLYTDRTHFVFELLQNAEDAGASRILFSLLNDKLEVTHDGRPFDEPDVRGVCGVGEGTKAEDLTQIGKFGIGFKSVYAYTTKPEVHSGDENFRVEDYVRPCAVKPRNIGNSYTTLFVFLLDAPSIDSEVACREISTCLRNLNARTLLFLKNIKEIGYELPDTNGIYIREEKTQDSVRRIEVIGQGNGQEENENWLIFERLVSVPDNDEKVSVEVGFRLVTNTEDETENIQKESNTPLVVYFPTEKATGLGFLIQGPYRTTPARDNIPKDNDWNKKLIEETAKLVVESLRQLKEMGLLSVSLLDVLPIRMEDFPEENMFYPIFSRVRDALISEELLPSNDGTFVAARNAKLVRGTELIQLLDQDQRSVLFQSDDKVKWLSTDITLDRTPDLRSYLMRELEVVEVTPEIFARNLSERFLASQDDEWFIRFYKYLSGQDALWRSPRRNYFRSRGILRSKPILRLQGGAHVNPFQPSGSPNAYLVDGEDTETSLPIVKVSLSWDKDARQFLTDLGIPKLDVVAEIIEKIIPKYTNNSKAVPIDEHEQDMIKMEKAWKTDSQEQKQQLQSKLSSTPFIRVESQSKRKIIYMKPSEVYFGNNNLRLYFSGNKNFGFVHPDYSQSAKDLFECLGVSSSVRVKRREINSYGFVIISNSHSNHKRGIKGFDPDIRIDGLEYALNSPTREKSAFIWERIARLHSDCIRGEVESSKRQTYAGSSKEEQRSKFGMLLADIAWLPSLDGNMHKPGELTLDDIPEEFTTDETLADQLGMKKDDIAKLAEKAGISKTVLDYARQIEKAPRELQQKIDSLLQGESKRQPHFPEKSSAEPERRQEQLIEQYGNADEKEYEPRTRSVRVTEATEDVRVWLKENYTNKEDQMMCQICKMEMPFKKHDGEYYFEAVEALSKDYFPKEHEAQFLALCPLCTAMYKEFIKREETTMKDLHDVLKNSNELEVTLMLGDLETSIRFVETHYRDIKTIIELEIR